VAGALGVRWWLRGTVPPLGGREAVAGLHDSVTILWDSLAVPHIIARSDTDFFTALGYVHARDRLWQMDLLRHAAEGRLSELFGAATIAADRAQRARETAGLARIRLAQASAASRAAAEAYARGVNAWIARNQLPPEFRILGHRPEPWEPRHSLEVALLEAWDLRTTGAEIALARAAARLGDARAAELAPVYPPDAPTIIPGTATRSSAAATDAGLHPRLEDGDSHPGASNSWVLGPSRTRSHKPILANDPHLALRAPSIWYLVGAHAPGYEAVGVTIPGAPVIVLGHSARMAWGFTNGTVDDVDYVMEQLTPDSSRYRTASGWATVEAVPETILVHGGGPVVYARRRTVHGPLVDVGWRPDSTTEFALRWVAQDPTDDLVGFLGMARATNRAEFARAIEAFRSPEQNIVYADTAGTIAYFLAGHIPVRRGGHGDRPTPGWTDEGRWVRYLTAAELPQMVNPAEGFIVTANNKIAGPSYPYFLSTDWELPYRAERIREMVSADSAATAASVAREQLDQVDVFARAMAPRAAHAAAAAGRPDLAEELGRWDGTMVPGSTVPTLFWSWYRALQHLAYDGDSPTYQPASPLHYRLSHGQLDSLARLAMDRVLARGTSWIRPWGAAQTLTQEHPLGGVSLLRLFLGFNVGPTPVGGDGYTVNVCHSAEARAPFHCTDGPSMRHVVDLGEVDGAGGFILPTGQSGNPVSPHYRDQTERWLRGELWLLPIDVRKVAAVDTLVLTTR
jgi:penicillin G amidase